MKLYTHRWKLKDTGQFWNPEPEEVCDPSSTLSGAIDTYYHEKFSGVSYFDTLVTDYETGVVEEIDIEEEIKERELAARTSSQIAWDKGCDEYHDRRDA